MSDNQDKNSKNSAQQILKKIQQQSPQQKKRRTLQILQNKNTIPPLQQPRQKLFKNYFEFAKNWYNTNYELLLRRASTAHFQKTVFMTAFLIFATYVCWKIQSKYDFMRKKASRTRTFKQSQIQQQNKRINRFLAKNAYQPVPITNQPEIKNIYKFQQQDAFDTKDQLLQALALEYKNGADLDAEIIRQLDEKGFI